MQTIDSIQHFLQTNDASVLYFSAPGCNVCHALKPKLFDALESACPTMTFESIDISISQDIAAYFNVFSIPTILIFFQGKEFLRKTRNMSVMEVVDTVKRPYKIMVEN